MPIIPDSLSPKRMLAVFCALFSFAFVCLFIFYKDTYFRPSNAVVFAAKSYWNYSVQDARRFAWKNDMMKRNYRPSNYAVRNLSFDRIRNDPTAAFNIEGQDVIVFLHIQKTAGTTFESFLVKHLDLERPCQCSPLRKRCQCLRPHSKRGQWLFSRFSTGWSCGLHADWTELVTSNCVDNVLDRKEKTTLKRRYFYTTFLREPVARYISEYSHVNRGATWGGSRHICNGRKPTPDELPLCYDPELGWDGVSLNEFLDCPFNQAINRQTRMMADLTLVNCYNQSSLPKAKRDAILLESAKKNLMSMSFFGIQSKMNKSQFLFEEIFDLEFTHFMDDFHGKSKSAKVNVTDDQIEKIRQTNHLDIELYEFAVQVFEKRYRDLQADQDKDDQKPINGIAENITEMSKDKDSQNSMN